VDLDRLPAPTATELTQLGLAPGRRAILSAARLDPQKRLDWLLQRAADFLPQLPNHDLVLAGQGPQERPLRRLAKRLGIDRRVHFCGWRGDLDGIIAGSDLLVLTSRWEGLPRAVLEVMASGKPVVTTAVEGVAELLGPLAPGQLHPSNDAAGFTQAVVAFASTADLAADQGRRNRQRVADHFTLERTVTAYEALYRAILNGNL
jgi:glycosyltransferase involved in cell wall biosynthesis